MSTTIFRRLLVSHAWKEQISEYENTIGVQIVIVAVSLFILLGLRSFTLSKPEDGNSTTINHCRQRKVRTVEDIPRHRHYTSIIPVPTIVEGLTTLHNLKQEGVKVLERWAQRYGPIFEISVLTGNVIAIQDPALIQKILGSTDITLQNKPRFLYDTIFIEWFRHGLIASEVDIWAAHKKMVARTVHYNALPGYLKMMNKHARTLVGDLVSECPKNDGCLQGQLIYDLLYSHSIKIISEILLGSESSSGAESEEFHDHFKLWKMLVVYKLFHPENLIPPIWWLNPKKKEYDNHVSKIREYINRDIQRVKLEAKLGSEVGGAGENMERATGVDGIKPFKSLIQQMVDYKSTEKEIYDEVGTFMSAGHETTVVAMNFFMQHMADNPEIQTKCQEELDELFNSAQSGGDFDQDYLTMDDLSELKYLERCILETLRITPTVPIFLRQSSAPVHVDEFKFKSGTTFCFMPWAVHRDPATYPNPDKFDPDRFLADNVKKRNTFAFIPFGQGPRICLGWKLAMMEMKVVLAWLLRHFDIRSKDRLEDVKMFFEFTLSLERNYRITLNKREH